MNLGIISNDIIACAKLNHGGLEPLVKEIFHQFANNIPLNSTFESASLVNKELSAWLTAKANLRKGATLLENFYRKETPLTKGKSLHSAMAARKSFNQFSLLINTTMEVK